MNHWTCHALHESVRGQDLLLEQQSRVQPSLLGFMAIKPTRSTAHAIWGLSFFKVDEMQSPVRFGHCGKYRWSCEKMVDRADTRLSYVGSGPIPNVERVVQLSSVRVQRNLLCRMKDMTGCCWRWPMRCASNGIINLKG